MLPAGLQARLMRDTWTRPAIFDWLQRHGNVADAEMHRVFNCGIGMAVVVAAGHADRALKFLAAAERPSHRQIVAQPANPRLSSDAARDVARQT
jgi:phosphoribosylformylglycinamidine cyclo-ligase